MSADQLHTVIGWVTAGAFIVAVAAAAALVWTNTSASTYARGQARARAELSLPPSQQATYRNWHASGEPRNYWRAYEYDQDWNTDRSNPAPTPRHAAPGDDTVDLTLSMPVVDLSQWGAHEFDDAA